MHRFFVSAENIDPENGYIAVTGEDVNHIRNVLRMKSGEQILLCTGEAGDETEYLCAVEEVRPDRVVTRILDFGRSARELAADLYLFQAIPKGDRFETVIEKSVELGVHAVIPVMTARVIVRLDEKRAEKKTARWNSIALSAAKQSKRSFLPEVSLPVSFDDALQQAKGLDRILVPYENAEGMAYTRQVLSEVKAGEKVGIFIGPEGGFEEEEIDRLKSAGAQAVTLGHRILRSDTAGPAVLAMLSLYLEE